MKCPHCNCDINLISTQNPDLPIRFLEFAPIEDSWTVNLKGNIDAHAEEE